MSDGRTDGRLPIESRRTNLTLAVRLVDEFTQERPTSEEGPSAAGGGDRRPELSSATTGSSQPIGRYPCVSLRVGNRVVPAVRNASGFDLFLDVAVPDDATPTLEVEGGPRYVDESHPVDLESLSPLRPRTSDEGARDPLDVLDDVRRWRDTAPTYQEIGLRPSPAYRFPPGATLVRGHVRDPDGNPLRDVTLTVDELARDTETTRKGEFVLYFARLTEDDVTEDGQVRVGGTNPGIEVRHDPDDRDTTESFGTDTVSLTAEEGRTHVYALEFEARDSVNATDVTST